MAGLVPATLAIVAQLWPADRRGVPLGVVGAVQELGSVLGPVLGALVLVVADWRAIFWLNAVLGLLAGAVVVTGGGGCRAPPLVVVLSAVAAVARGLALAAPDVLVTSVSLGLPFVPFGDATSRLATPDRAGRRRAPPRGARRRVAAAPGRSCGGPTCSGPCSSGARSGASCSPSPRPSRRARWSGPLGYALLPVAALLVAGVCRAPPPSPSPLVPRGLVRGRLVWALVVSLLVGVALVAVVVDVPLLARLVHTAEPDRGGARARPLPRRRAGGGPRRRLGAAAPRQRRRRGVGLGAGAVGLAVMSTWGRGSLEEASSTLVLALTGLGIGLALAPVNDAALAEASHDAHGTASALVVVARMVGMVVGVALLTAIGLHQYYDAVAALPDPTDTDALKDAAVLQVTSVFRGAAAARARGAWRRSPWGCAAGPGRARDDVRPLVGLTAVGAEPGGSSVGTMATTADLLLDALGRVRETVHAVLEDDPGGPSGGTPPADGPTPSRGSSGTSPGSSTSTSPRSSASSRCGPPRGGTTGSACPSRRAHGSGMTFDEVLLVRASAEHLRATSTPRTTWPAEHLRGHRRRPRPGRRRALGPSRDARRAVGQCGRRLRAARRPGGLRERHPHPVTAAAAPAGIRRQSSSSTTTGAWSLAPTPLRSSRSMTAPATSAASAGDPRTKSMRMPRFLGNASRW